MLLYGRLGLYLELSNLRHLIGKICGGGAASAGNSANLAGTALRDTSNTASMPMTTGMGVNGFWRIGRLVSCIMMEDDNAKLNAINARPATTNYMAY